MYFWHSTVYVLLPSYITASRYRYSRISEAGPHSLSKLKLHYVGGHQASMYKLTITSFLSMDHLPPWSDQSKRGTYSWYTPANFRALHTTLLAYLAFPFLVYYLTNTNARYFHATHITCRRTTATPQNTKHVKGKIYVVMPIHHLLSDGFQFSAVTRKLKLVINPSHQNLG